jgi:hypothetical protein
VAKVFRKDLCWDVLDVLSPVMHDGFRNALGEGSEES